MGPMNIEWANPANREAAKTQVLSKVQSKDVPPTVEDNSPPEPAAKTAKLKQVDSESGDQEATKTDKDKTGRAEEEAKISMKAPTHHDVLIYFVAIALVFSILGFYVFPRKPSELRDQLTDTFDDL